MKYLILSCVFSPEPAISGRVSTELANELRRMRHEVRVITAFPNHPGGKLYAGYKQRLWAHDNSFDGYDVLRCFSFFSSKSSMVSRFLENLSFGITSGLAVLFAEKPDAIYGNTWPIFAQGILALVCLLRDIPLVMSVQDIYPETLRIQGRAHKLDVLYSKPLRWLDKKISQCASAILVISEQFRDIYVQDRGIPARKVHVIPNWIDEHQLQVGLVDHAIRDRYNIPSNAFLVVYAGNIGFAAGLDTVLLAFNRLVAHAAIYLLMAGDGSMLAHYRKLAQKIENPRIFFHTPWPVFETSSLMAAATLFILPTQGKQSMFSVPSKLISYMLAGRPILACVEEKSETARIIKDACCGWVIPAENPEILSDKLLLLSQFPREELEEYGKRGRDCALKEMTRAANLPKLLELMDKVASRNDGHTGNSSKRRS